MLSPEPTPIPSLPDDLLVSCLARVSRLYYPNLSLVSKRFRSILTSPELYKTRTLFGRTETFLYVCLRFPEEEEPNPRWFILCRKPNQTLTTKKKKKECSSGYHLAPISILNSPPMELTSLVAVGSNLYAIGSATDDDTPCSNVSFLDCRTHTWLEAPRMRMVNSDEDIGGRMYLAGSFEKPESLKCVEVYNTKTQTWNPADPKKQFLEFRDLEGKVYMNMDKIDVSLKPKDLTFELVGLDKKFNGCPVCMIDNTTYRYVRRRKFVWGEFDTKGELWNKLQGLEGLPKFPSYSTVRLADYGGKLLVLWDKYVRGSGYNEKMIWCAEISLEKRNNEEIWGKVEWLNPVLTVPNPYNTLCAVAATV